MNSFLQQTIVTKPTVVEYIKKTEPLFAKPRTYISKKISFIAHDSGFVYPGEILIGDYLPEWTFSKKP